MSSPGAAQEQPRSSRAPLTSRVAIGCIDTSLASGHVGPTCWGVSALSPPHSQTLRAVSRGSTVLAIVCCHIEIIVVTYSADSTATR